MDDGAQLTRTELRSTVRVYAKSWVFDSRHVTEGEAHVVALAKFGGRLDPEDIAIRADEIRYEPWELWTRIWNVGGEFKYEDDANVRAEELRGAGFEVNVVDRNSREEHRLTSYGKVKLA